MEPNKFTGSERSFQREENGGKGQMPVEPRLKQAESSDRRSGDISMGEASNLRFGESEVADEAKNIAIRSKLSFFRRSLVLYRGADMEVAVRSSDLVDYERRKISIYVNNRDRFEREASIEYKFNPDYYGLRVSKKLQIVQGRTQER